MTRLFILTLFILPLSGNAQIGVFGSYNSMNTPAENDYMAQAQLFQPTLYQQSYSLGIDYWWRPEKFRWEFYPSLVFQQATNDSFTSGSFSVRDLGFHLNMNIYPFDFLSDCDCPTFSKQDPIFKRGFFLQLSPGLNWSTHEHDFSGQPAPTLIQEGLTYRLGIGAGLDLGLSDFFTISPYVRHVWRIEGADKNYSNFPPFIENGVVHSAEAPDWTQWEFGLHFGFRFNE
ncbi:MAG: hypothetical protein GYB31_09920 [Bacteroidetes bacterium]|nr:hypothetical protein [Bacteroidota bacterium]